MSTYRDDVIVQTYNYSKTQAQLISVTLEEVKTTKHSNETHGDYIAQLEFIKGTVVIDENTVDGFLRVIVRIKRAEELTEDLELDIVYRGRFMRKPESIELDLENWVDIQIVPLLLSYVRTFISSISVQMGYDAIIIPTIDVIDSIKANLRDDQAEEVEINVDQSN